MDTPNLPENETEEITWQDDENRATLFLRSVFVLLSAALIVGTELHTSFSQLWIEALYLLGMNILFPVCIIWFFFGQGLRPVEWLTDQKYNAWNFGINFKDWKTHLKWAAILCLGEIALCAVIRIPRYVLPSLAQSPQDWFLLWLIAASYIWLFWGYLLFGCIQGFSKTFTFILLAVALCIGVNLLWSSFPQMIMIVPFSLIPFFGFILCWKTKSLAPMLYSSMLFLTIIFTLTAIMFMLLI